MARSEFRIVIEVRDEIDNRVTCDVVYRCSGPNRAALRAETIAIAQALAEHVDDEVKYARENN